MGESNQEKGSGPLKAISMALTPKNWHSFQHYKKRNPPWIKLHKTLLDDCEFQHLPLASRALAPMLWLLASDATDGVIRSDSEALAYRLRISIDALSEGLDPLLLAGFFLDDCNMLASCKRGATPETEGEAKSHSQEDELLQGTSVGAARVTESQEPSNIDETWNVPDDDFRDEGYDSVYTGIDPVDVALAQFNDDDAKKLSEAGASVEDCNNIAELIRQTGGTLESVEREK